jgi:hypothetical protein
MCITLWNMSDPRGEIRVGCGWQLCPVCRPTCAEMTFLKANLLELLAVLGLC